MSQFDLRGIGMTSQRTRDRLVQRLRDHGITDERVLAVIGEVPRHIFIDEALSTRAYEDTALPIGHGQTISQPLVVAFGWEARPFKRVSWTKRAASWMRSAMRAKSSISPKTK